MRLDERKEKTAKGPDREKIFFQVNQKTQERNTQLDKGREYSEKPGLWVKNESVSFNAFQIVLHLGVIWTPATLWNHPVYVLAWILNVTRFAMYTVLCVDLEIQTAILFGFFLL